MTQGITAIIMVRKKITNGVGKMRKPLLVILVANALGTSSMLSAGELSFAPALDTSLVQQKYTFASDTQRDINTLVVTPSFTAEYVARKFTLGATASHTQQESNVDEDTQEDSFTSYRVNGEFFIVDRLLYITAASTQNYQSFNPNQFAVEDFLFRDTPLRKNTRQQISVNSNVQNNDYINGNLQAFFSDFNIAALETEVSDRESSTSGFSAQLRQGDDSKAMTWSLVLNQQDSEQFSTNDLSTRYAQLTTNFRVFSDVGLTATAQTEQNEVTGTTQDFSQLRDFSSVGLGINYSPSANRIIALTYNQGTTDGLNGVADEEVNFVAGSIDWAFSSRTLLNLTASKRFYGRSANGTFSYNTKYWRASAMRSETVTSTSRLLNEGSSLETFVCPAGGGSVGDCFLPDTLDYTLGAGENFVNFLQPNISLEDSIILRKNTVLSVGYQKRKLSLSFSASVNEDENQANLVTTETESKNASITYKVGARSSLSLTWTDSETTRIDNDNNTLSGNTDKVALKFERTFGRDWSANTELANINREGFVPGFATQGDELKDKRFSVGLSYQPKLK